jgi:Family of unknown function (DUF5999)
VFQTPSPLRRSTARNGNRCPHVPPCPAASAPDHRAARIVASHPEQGWNLLCNGVVAFDDYGEILPDGTCTPAQQHAGHALAHAA